MADYNNVRTKKLVLKGEKKKKRKHKKESVEVPEKREKNDEDALRHGGWAVVSCTEEITGSIAIEFGTRTYMKALDNGLFTLGAPHDEDVPFNSAPSVLDFTGDGPAPEEIFTAFSVGETKIAIKSGYGKYLQVSKGGEVTGRADAVGPMEQWEPVFQDGKMALLGCLGCFMAVDPETDNIVANSRKVEEHEILQVRSPSVSDSNLEDNRPEEERGKLNEVEENYVRKFQKFQDKKLKIDLSDRSTLKRARDEGALHEALLDRRSKMKADRYCK